MSIAQRQFRAQKTALTKAINKADAAAIVAATTKAVSEWEGNAWPDSWHRWQRALDDAFNIAHAAYVHGETNVAPDANDYDIDLIRRKVVLSA